MLAQVPQLTSVSGLVGVAGRLPQTQPVDAQVAHGGHVMVSPQPSERITPHWDEVSSVPSPAVDWHCALYVGSHPRAEA